MGCRSNHETATKKKKGNKNAYKLTAALEGQRCWLSKKSLRSAGLKREAFLPGLDSSEHLPGFIAS